MSKHDKLESLFDLKANSFLDPDPMTTCLLEEEEKECRVLYPNEVEGILQRATLYAEKRGANIEHHQMVRVPV
jgi:hypothetical protein